MVAYFSRRLRSLRAALRGMGRLIQTQPNARVHVVATLVVLAVGMHWQVSNAEWLWLGLASTLVWVTEALNSALEQLADRVTKERDPLIRDAKDMAAAAVLIAACFSVGVAVAVFGPKLWR